ncbi:hypothetical protein FM038_005275 [Shewanella eurypsychrophilus]|uniref:Uncharacterized protein n=1 Tax=Shewanella eurypsychrophilus TaxID=2593656 RepID=A0ABX6V505_9GAMM|nr:MULTISPECIES: hypothetical protein [Shewanella]QFU21620.1 hypothetical protein FS418_06855 [Shewanella sp. YLB-09]QPG56910.1 hypothetical protein FM038_005275 [Shewanella eurypsychrophilus]
MFLSNAQRWAQICERQAEIIENLSKTFPERRDNHSDIGISWRRLGDQVSRGQSLNTLDLSNK